VKDFSLKISQLEMTSMNLKRWSKTKLPPTVYRRLVPAGRSLLGWWYRDDLNRLASLFGTDKWGSHWYTPHYQRYFAPLKTKHLNVLEIGVGGYVSEWGGSSLRMWKAYFRRSRIVGIDLCDKSHFSENRVDVRQCDQADSEALNSLSSEYGGFDIIIDDGSHLNEDVIKTFKILFPLLRQDGIYVVEDTQTAYWPTWGGGLNNPNTSMAFFKGLADGLNHVEYPLVDFKPSYFDRHIIEITFLHNLIFIRKGNNDEKPNAPALIRRELDAAQSPSVTRHS
jgi:Methyltransferase domain